MDMRCLTATCKAIHGEALHICDNSHMSHTSDIQIVPDQDDLAPHAKAECYHACEQSDTASQWHTRDITTGKKHSKASRAGQDRAGQSMYGRAKQGKAGHAAGQQRHFAHVVQHSFHSQPSLYHEHKTSQK